VEAAFPHSSKLSWQIMEGYQGGAKANQFSQGLYVTSNEEANQGLSLNMHSTGD
jgi:hypothetical protein